MKALALAAGLAIVFTTLRTAHAEPAPVPVFGLSLAMARDESGQRVVDDTWLKNQLDDVNRVFGPIGPRFRWTAEKPLAEPHGALHSRADCDALTPLTESKVIDVFVVRELEDVDEPGRYRMGVCWSGRGGKRFIVLSRIARPTVLAHELGHYFGNPHSTVMNNLMSYSRDGAAVFLDQRQSATVQSFAARFLKTGTLSDVDTEITQ